VLLLVMISLRLVATLESTSSFSIFVAVVGVTLSMAAISLSIVAAHLQGLCCRSLDDGGLCCVQCADCCLIGTRSVECFRVRSEKVFWNLLWPLILFICMLAILDLLTIPFAKDHNFGVGIVMAAVGYFWMEISILFFLFVIVSMNLKCSGRSLGPFYFCEAELEL
jgi:hypothetical protein